MISQNRATAKKLLLCYIFQSLHYKYNFNAYNSIYNGSSSSSYSCVMLLCHKSHIIMVGNSLSIAITTRVEKLLIISEEFRDSG